MVDLDILREYGCSEESLRELFRMDKDGFLERETTEKGRRLKSLRELIRSRINEGRDTNTSNYRVYQALDKAWDAPLNQITPTMIQSLIDSNMDTDKLSDALKTWGVNLSDVMDEWVDPKTNQTIKKVNVPAFYRIVVPLVRAYVTIRRAKMMNDRRIVPFMKYTPAISTEKARMRCEVITSRVEAVSDQYGFWDVEDQACWRMLHYGICLRFIVEEWHKEEQLVEYDSPYEGEDVLGKSTTPADTSTPSPTQDAPPDSIMAPFAQAVEGEASTPIPEPEPADVPMYKRVCMREGLRYHMPHPTRMFYDMAWPAHSFNTNTGATYAGYWRVMRYGEILNKKKFFNLSVVAVGNAGTWFNNNKAFFDSVYPCTLRFPGTEEAGAGAGQYDSERKIADGVYTTADEDKGLIITELFMKLVPADYGIGDYEHPVWFRFVVANNDTIIYATPLPYSSPVLFDGYDHVTGRSLSPSMSLEVLPYQDHMGNLLSQYLLSVKQNLTNMVLVDSDAVSTKDISFLQKWTQKLWSGINIIPFSRRQWTKGQQVPEVTFPQRFPQVDTASIAVAMKSVLEILERVLVMSAQELGQAASHEQTREEVRNIQTNTSTRASFTATSLDRSKQAWKRQIYEGLMAYGSENGYAQLPSEDFTPDVLSKLGFTHEGYDTVNKKLTVKYNKTAIKYETFSANRDVDDRINDKELAAQMGAFMQQLASNPIMLNALGPDQFILMANSVAKAAGFPRDLVLRNRGGDVTPEENNAQILQQVQEFLGQAMEQLKTEMGDEIKGVITEVVKVNDEQTDEIEANQQEIKKVSDELIRLQNAVSQAQESMLPPTLPISPSMPSAMPAGMGM